MLALVVTVASDDVELASDALWALGVVAIEERSSLSGDVELWTALGDDEPSIDRLLNDRLLNDLARAASAHWRWRFVEVDESVADTWRAHAQPTWVTDRITVVPAWLPSPDVSADVMAISIEPGATFGAGDHPTTVLSLRALDELVRTAGERAGEWRVLDVGCGSGVLAVAAAMLGVAAADGLDISPAAVPVTRANAAANGVADAVTVSTIPLAEVPAGYDLVLANILAPTLVDLADDLLRVMLPGATLVISGVLADRFQHVVDALAPLRVCATVELAGWAAVTLRR
jgi:ribosomal protein L11 methyltransferase